MNSKKITLALLLFIITSVSISQSKSGKFLLFKLYKGAEFDLGQTQATSTVSLSTFTPAIAWGEGANFHEIHITSLDFFSRARTSFLYSGGMEYTYNHQFSDVEDSKFNFFFGGGLGFGFSTKNSSFENANSIFIPTVGKFVNFNLVAIPRITYDVLNNIALDISLAYNLMEYEYSRHTASEPTLPINASTNVYNDLSFVPRKFTLRVAGIIRF